MGLTPRQMGAAVIANLPKRTGRTLAEWIALVRSQGPAQKREQIAWLKQEHGLVSVQASVIVDEAEKPEDYRPASDEELPGWIKAAYEGGR